MDKLLQHTDRGVRTLTLNRPEKRNALDHGLTLALLRALEAAESSADVGVVVLTGQGPSFCSGADVSEFKTLTPANADRVEERAELTMKLHLAISQMSKPVIASVNGPAMGGGAGLAIACDMVVMAQSARLGYPEISKGIVAAIVLTNLIKQAGRKAAFQLVATGQSIDAGDALALGMANAVVPDDQLQAETINLALQLASFSRKAMAATKTIFHEVADLPLPEGLKIGRALNQRMRSFLQENI